MSNKLILDVGIAAEVTVSISDGEVQMLIQALASRIDFWKTVASEGQASGMHALAAEQVIAWEKLLNKVECS